MHRFCRHDFGGIPVPVLTTRRLLLALGSRQRDSDERGQYVLRSRMTERPDKIPARWRKRVEKARKALKRSQAERELGLKQPLLTARGGPQAADFKTTRRR